LYPFNFVGAAESAVATGEKQETKQRTTTPAAAAFVESRPSIVTDGASTWIQSEDENMGRWGRGPLASAQIVASLRRVEVGAGGLVLWNAFGFLEAAFWDTGAPNALEGAFWSLLAHPADGLPPAVVIAAADCMWMARVAIKMLVRALRVRLRFMTSKVLRIAAFGGGGGGRGAVLGELLRMSAASS
jgi:hypothetical protein